MYTTKFSWSCQFLPIFANFCQLLQILLLLHNKMKVCESTSVWKGELREGFLVVIMLIYWVCTTGGGEGRDQKSWKGSAAVANFGKSVSIDLSYDHWQWRLVIWHFKWLIIWQKSDTITTTAMVIMENQHIVNTIEISMCQTSSFSTFDGMS